jgi:hypothetical protein
MGFQTPPDRRAVMTVQRYETKQPTTTVSHLKGYTSLKILKSSSFQHDFITNSSMFSLINSHKYDLFDLEKRTKPTSEEFLKISVRSKIQKTKTMYHIY